jgi:hypothetical protein
MKKKIIVIGIIIFLIFLGWLVTRNSGNNQQQTIKTTLTPTLTETELYSSDEQQDYEENGQSDISDQDQKIYDEIGNLIDKLPIKNDQFSLFFDYDVNKFVILYKDSGINNLDILKDWLVANNFGNIPMENFIMANQLQKAGSSTFSLKYLLPYEENDFIVLKYIKDKVLLVQAKNGNLIKAKESLKKWLDLVEIKPGENIIVWQ